jgi:MFS family permease
MLDQLVDEAPLATSAGSRNLWRHWDFTKLWVGQTISTLGSGVTSSALPLTAVLLLNANAGDMGSLLAAESAPVLLVGMFAGVWVDRLRRRPLLIGADLGRAALLVAKAERRAGVDALERQQWWIALERQQWWTFPEVSICRLLRQDSDRLRSSVLSR